jgi:tetratricopeptide (TPR) repeat protein
MKLFCKILLCLAIACNCCAAFGQTDDAQSLVKQAVQFNKDGQFANAIDKYNQALKLDSNNIYANYGIAYSLLAAGNGKDGIPHLEKVIKANTSLTPDAYDLLGSIYDKNHETEKAIDAYNSGIKADPKSQSLYYNLGLVYFRDKKYADAEKCAIEAIKIDPKHASSQRMYALVCFHQNKRANALLGFCSFILLEPNTARSAEAYGNMQHILQGGTLKPAPGEAPLANDAATIALNQAITQSVAGAAREKHATATDELTAQLKNIFNAVGQLAEKQTGDDFFRKYYAAYFYQLVQTQNMPAFARQISLSTPESVAWAKANTQQMADLDGWLKSTARGFE